MPSIPLSLALAGLHRSGSVREHLAWATSIGFRAVQLNAMAVDMRPRDFSRSARRDLASELRRRELALSGIDLWIPPAHFVEPAHAQRAADAVAEALALASELAELLGGGGVVSVELPPDLQAESIVRQLGERAIQTRARLADHAWPSKWAGVCSGVSLGIDPAALLLAGADPAAETARYSPVISSVRLSDLATAGRVVPGRGRLDLLGYLVAITTCSATMSLIVDLRGLSEQESAARDVRRRLDPGEHP